MSKILYVFILNLVLFSNVIADTAPPASDEMPKVETHDIKKEAPLVEDNNNDKTVTVKTEKIIVVPQIGDISKLDPKDKAALKSVLGVQSGTKKVESKDASTGDFGELGKELVNEDISGVVARFKTQIKDLWRSVVDWRGFKIWKLVTLFVGLVISFSIARLARWVIENYLVMVFANKTKTDIDDLVCFALGKPVSLFIASFGIYLSSVAIVAAATPKVQEVFGRICIALAAFSVAWGAYRLVTVIDRGLTKLALRTDNNVDDLVVAIIRKCLKVLIVVVSILLIGQNILGLNITTLIAGAGVAGLAIAFAAQNTIANFFGSIMIVLDSPFKVADRVKLAGYEGFIEHVGFRSTRLRTLDGHLITIPNKEVADSSVENISKRPYMKQTTNLTLVYDTTPAQMDEAIGILHELFDKHEGMDEEFPPKIWFNSFNDWALNIQLVVWYHPAEYVQFMDWNHKMNMEILRRFNDAGLEFAFPTSTTYLAHDQKRKLEIKVDSKNKLKKKKKEKKS